LRELGDVGDWKNVNRYWENWGRKRRSWMWI